MKIKSRRVNDYRAEAERIVKGSIINNKDVQ